MTVAIVLFGAAALCLLLVLGDWAMHRFDEWHHRRRK